MRFSKIIAAALVIGCGHSMLYAATDIKTTKEAIATLKKYDEAVNIFNNKDYEEAYKRFLRLFDVRPDDSRINFYLGLSAFETKRYDEALAAFERVLIVEPNHVRSRLEMGRVYFEEKRV